MRVMRTLRLGNQGDDVRAWQSFLRDGGWYTGGIDGVFGTRTTGATRAFQRANHLDDDGVAGNQTLGAAMQRGLDLAPEDRAVTDGPDGTVISINDAWLPPTPPTTQDRNVARDPRVITQHQAGVLPCPPNPPPPVGWRYWQGDVPGGAAALANQVQGDPKAFPMGSFAQALIDGQLVGARVEWHDYQGKTGKHGCFRGTSLFRRKAE